MPLGLKRGMVKLEPHDERWGREAEKIVDVLKRILGKDAIDIQHVGSTAIASILAKPIIDIVVGANDFTLILKHNDELKRQGIYFKGADVDNQLLYVMGDFEKDTRTHHIHVVIWNDKEWNNYVNFRDFLNYNADVAFQYQLLKEKLESRYFNDRSAYTQGKQEMICNILVQARKWRNSQHRRKLKGNITDIFGNWSESIIWSCLQGVMGEIHTNSTDDAAMAILGDFAFYAGKPSEELIRFKPESCKQDFIIMIPQNDAWAALIEKCYGDKAKRVTRYAIKKEKDIFDICKLEQAILNLPEGYELKPLEEHEYVLCQNNRWANDLVSQFRDYDSYKKSGLGVVVLKDGELVAGASSYSRYNEGIEIEIDTKEDHRRKGLAYACGAKLILRCLEKGLYPSWDAQNMWSVSLAEKLGYHFSHEYAAYEIMGY